MFDIGWQELLVIAIVLVVVVGPKDLPRMLRAFGKATARMRTMAGEFRAQFDEALREADLDDVRKTISDAQSLNPAKSLRDAMNPLRQVGDEIRAGLDEAIRPSSVAPPPAEDAEALSPERSGEPLPEPQAVPTPGPAAPAKRKAAPRKTAAKSGGAKPAAGRRRKSASAGSAAAAPDSAGGGEKAAAATAGRQASRSSKPAGTASAPKGGNGAARKASPNGRARANGKAETAGASGSAAARSNGKRRAGDEAAPKPADKTENT